MSCFAAIFVPDFPVEAILRIEPELRSRPAAVLAGKAPLEKVFSANDKARALGVEPGMTKIQLESWKGLVLRPRSEAQEAAAHAALLDCAQSFSPSIEGTAPDTVLLDLQGLEHLFGSPSKIARDIARRAADLGLETNVAAASNADTAMLAARGFPGISVIPDGQEAKRLGDLSISVLFEGFLSTEQQKEADRILETFDRWGIRNLRSLAALPEIPLIERLGQQGLRLQQLARGTNHRPLKLVQPPLVFEESVELEHPIVLLEPLAFILNRLLDQVCSRLAARALAAQELKLRFELATEFQTEESESFPLKSSPETTDALASPSSPIASQTSTYTRTLQLPVPMLDARIFLKLLQLDLKAHPPGAPIMKINLNVEPARPRPAQAGLFLPPFPEPEKLELTLARIADMVGEGNVGSVQLDDTHRPESFRMERFAPKEPEPLDPKKIPPAKTDPTGPSKEKCFSQPSTTVLLEEAYSEEQNIIDIALPTVPSKVKPVENDAPITALRMFRPPLRAEVASREGTPVRMTCLKNKTLSGEIIWAAGPWRSAGDWWEQEGWARDEWDIMLQTTTGIALYRLVRDHFSNRWLLEGSYD
jgi:protein ImuB